jgi:hypothetical protein
MSLATDTRVFPAPGRSVESETQRTAPVPAQAPMLRPVVGIPFMHKFRAAVVSLRKG